MELALIDGRPPLPPADLILRVTRSFDLDDREGELNDFDLGGLAHLQSFERALEAVGNPLSSFNRLLDFGCGCGRFIRHLGSVADRIAVNGTDIDAEMIGWCRDNIPFGRFDVAPHEPPLPYADASFDLVLNHSVFTHLDERLQDLWLAELQRITLPGAILLLTVEGAASWSRTRKASEQIGEPTAHWQAELESRGILYIADDHFVGSTHPDFYHSTVHAPWYIFEHWTRFFDLAAYLPEGSDTQDLVVMRRRPDGVPGPQPIGCRPVTVSTQPEPSIPRTRDALRQLGRIARRQLAARRDGVDAEATKRELQMLRAGLYEQGNRISVLAAELRRDIESLRNGDHSSS